MTRRQGPRPAVPASDVGNPRRGRPLDPSRDVAIRAAALQVLAEDGYRGLTMDAVAMAAGVGKATIYRRWRSKEDLVVSAIQERSVDSLVVPDTGTLRDDLVHLLRSLAGVLTGPSGDADRAVLGVLPDEPDLAEAFRLGPLVQWAQAFSTVLRRAAERGEIPEGVERSLGAEAGPAILVERWLLGKPRIDDGVISAVVDDLMMPLLRRRGFAADTTA